MSASRKVNSRTKAICLAPANPATAKLSIKAIDNAAHNNTRLNVVGNKPSPKPAPLSTPPDPRSTCNTLAKAMGAATMAEERMPNSSRRPS